jgi:hypothetical protein
MFGRLSSAVPIQAKCCGDDQKFQVSLILTRKTPIALKSFRIPEESHFLIAWARRQGHWNNYT